MYPKLVYPIAIFSGIGDKATVHPNKNYLKNRDIQGEHYIDPDPSYHERNPYMGEYGNAFYRLNTTNS